MLKERKLTSVAVAGIIVASFCTASFANENGVDELTTSNIVNTWCVLHQRHCSKAE